MSEFTCVYQCRLEGSIGRFHDMSTVVQAANVKQAMAKAFDQLHAKGFETQFPVSCNELIGDSLRKEMQ